MKTYRDFAHVMVGLMLAGLATLVVDPPHADATREVAEFLLHQGALAAVVFAVFSRFWD